MTTLSSGGTETGVEAQRAATAAGVAVVGEVADVACSVVVLGLVVLL